MRCPYCQSSLRSETAQVCHACGRELDAEADQTAGDSIAGDSSTLGSDDFPDSLQASADDGSPGEAGATMMSDEFPDDGPRPARREDDEPNESGGTMMLPDDLSGGPRQASRDDDAEDPAGTMMVSGEFGGGPRPFDRSEKEPTDSGATFMSDEFPDEPMATQASSEDESPESSKTFLSDEMGDDSVAASAEQDDPRSTSPDQTFLSDEWPEHEPDQGGQTIALDAKDPGPPPAPPQQTMPSIDVPRHTGDTSVDATFISDEWPEHEGVEPVKKTRESSDAGDAGSSGATMTSDDFSNASESSGFVVVTRGDSSRSPDESSQTFVSDAPFDDELRTLQSNFGDMSGDQPSMTLKSGDEPAKKKKGKESVRGTLDTVPRRSMRSGETPSIDRPDYDLIKILGEGGMGVVWDARQTSVDRAVAVKMIKGPAATNRTQRQKFLAEAIVTGDLDHPNIVPIYDVGTDEKGVLFYSMKQVHGTPWLKVLKKKSLNENLEILLRTADAVAFAHSRGIIHRDLKPENVMLGSFGETLVMDWGLALPTAQFTKGRDVVQPGMGGTPAYMAPEMATGPIDRITFASDIYLLGAILFEMVTNKAPHPGKKVQECLLNAMRNVWSETDKTGELIDIAYKAMATEPKDRYATVPDFQKAIRSYLSHSESIAMAVRASDDLELAKKSREYTDFNKAVFGFEEALDLWKQNAQAETGLSAARLAYAKEALAKGDFDLGLSLAKGSEPEQISVRNDLRAAQDEREARKRRLAAAKRVMGAMAAAIFVIVSISFLWIRSERNFALTQRDKAIEQEGIATQQKAIAVKERDNAQTQEKIANEQKVIATKERDNAKTQEMIALQQKKLADEQRVVADQKRKEADEQKQIATKERDNAKMQEMIALQQKKLADEQRILADQKRKEADEQRALAVSAKEAEEYEAYIARIGLAAAKIDENAFDVAEEILNQCKPELRNWEWGRLKHLCSQTTQEFKVGGPVDSVAVSPDGKLAAAASWDRKARVWDLESGKLLFEIPHDGLYVHGIAWSPDGTMLATGGSAKGKYLNLWDAKTGKLVTAIPGHTDAVVSVGFSDNGKWLVSTSYDNTARLWDLTDRSHPVEAAVLSEHNWWVWDAAFSPGFDPGAEKGTNAIVTVSQDGKAIVWSVSKTDEAGKTAIKAEAHGTFTSHDGPVYGVAFDPTGKQVATAGYDRRILLWNPAEVPKFTFGATTEQPQVKVVELAGHTAPVQSVNFSKDGSLLVSGGRDNAVKVWSVAQARAIKTLRGHFSGVRSAAFTPDGRNVVSGSQDQRIVEWGVDAYEEFRTLEGRTLSGHADAILSASFSPDGKEVITASRDRTARSWETATGKPLHTFREGHDYLASNALFFQDGRTLVTSAADNTARFWDIASGTQFLRLPGTGRSAAASLAPDEKWLVTGSEENNATLWDLRKLTRDASETETAALPGSRPLAGHNARVSAVVFSPSENLVATGDTNGRCILRRIKDDGTDETVWTARHNTRRITSLQFLPSGQILAASSDHTVARLDQKTGEEVDGLVLKHKTAVSGLAVSRDGAKIATVSDLSADEGSFKEGSRVTLFDAATAQPIQTLDIKEYSVTSLDFVLDGSAILAACSDNTVRVLKPGADEPIGKPVLDFQQRGGIVWSARFTRDGRSMVTIGGSDARLWDTATGRESMAFSPHGAVASARFSPDGHRVVTGSWDNSARIWNADTGKALLKLEQGHTSYVNSTVYSPKGDKVLTTSDDGTAKLWNAETGEILATLTGHKDRVRWGVFSADGAQILTASNDKTARLWEAQSGKQVGEPFVGHTWAVLCAQFSPDGKRILTGSEDNEARIWNVEDRKVIATLQGHTAAVTSVAFSKDGQRVFTASQDNAAKLWDASAGHEGKEILTLKGHNQEVTSVTFSPDGRQVLTASRDGKAILWLTTDWTHQANPEVTQRKL
jgi:WD40 repeat protein